MENGKEKEVSAARAAEGKEVEAGAAGATAVEGQVAAAVVPTAEEVARAAVLAYEARHGLRDGRRVAARREGGAASEAVEVKEKEKEAKAEGAGAQGAAGKDAAALRLEALMARVDTLTARLEGMETARVAAARAAEVARLAERLPEPMRGVYGRLPVGAMGEAEWGEERARVEKEVEATVQLLRAQGYSFAPPMEGGGGAARAAEATEEELKAVLARANV